MIYIVIILVAGGLMLLVFSQRTDHTYKAQFGNSFEFLGFWNHGFSIGSRSVSKRLSHTNMMCCGQTGAGKGVSVVIPSLISLSRARSSIIILDISSQNFKRTAPYFKKIGYNVKRINFSDPIRSETFNYLDYCKSASDIHKGATLIYKCTNGDKKSEIFWEQSSIMMMSMFGRFLKLHCDPKYCNIQNILRLVERFSVDGPSVDRLFARTNDEELLSAYKATVAMSDRTLQSVISSVRASLNLWTDPSVCMTTATSSINFSELRNDLKPTIIYACTELKDLDYFKPITSLFFSQCFNHIFSYLPDEHEDTRSIFFILDEFGSCRFTDDFPNLISNCRRYFVGIQICLQDESVISAIYGDKSAAQITTNCAIKCFLKGTPLHSAVRLSQTFGKYTYIDKKGIERTRELMTPDEIRMCDDALVLISNQRPLRVKATPYFKNFRLQHLRHTAPFELEEKIVTTNLPLIPFD